MIMVRMIVLLFILNVMGLAVLSSITIPYYENFDSVDEPALPPGWTAVETSVDISYVDTNSNESYSDPNHLHLYDSLNPGYVMAVMPAVNPGLPIHMSSISFWAKTYPADKSFWVGSMDLDATADSFHPIKQFTVGSHWQLINCNLAIVNAGQPRIAFKVEGETTGTHLMIDDVDLHYSLSQDLEICDLTAAIPFISQREIQFSVSVVNQGYSPIDSYSIVLLDSLDAVLANMIGSPIQAGETICLSASISLPTPGNYVYKAILTCPGDQNPDNDLSEPALVEVFPPGLIIHEDVGSPQYQNKYPIDLYWKTSLCETLYLSSDLPQENRLIWGIAYSATIYTPTIGIKPIVVWMGHTQAPDLLEGWIPANVMEKVFTGPVNFSPGEHLVNIVFQQPFLYEAGNNLAVMVLRPLDSRYYTSNDDFYCFVTETNVTRMIRSDVVVYDPNNPGPVAACDFKPVTYFLTTDPPVSGNDPVSPALESMEIYPNPFNPNTTISFTLGSSGTARVEIFNLKGQLVKSLWQGNLSSGEHSLAWDATDDEGRALPSGMYLLKLECGANIQIGKLMLMK
jgi:hypothetical protein